MPYDHTDEVTVHVYLKNDAGETFTAVRTAKTVDRAVQLAENESREATGDDSWTMDDWKAS